MADVEHRYRYINGHPPAGWLWEYDGDESMPARMYWIPPEDRHFYVPTQHGPPKPAWCRFPWCSNDVPAGDFCETHASLSGAPSSTERP